MMGVLAVGIAALMLISSLSTSIEDTLGENVYDVLSSDITIIPVRRDRDAMITDSEACIREIDMNSDVKASSPRIEVEGLISTGNGWKNTSGALIYGVDPERDQKVTSLDDYFINGEYQDFIDVAEDGKDDGLPPIIIGKKFLDRWKLRVEDGDGQLDPDEKVRLTLGRLRDVDGDITPIILDFKIVGVYETRLPYFDDLTVFIPIEQCRYLMDLNPFDPKANMILVKLDDPGDADDLKDEILADIADKSEEPMRGRTHEEYKDHYLNDLIETTRPVGYLIITISLAAAILRMAHTSASSVQERLYDIGILRAIGFKKKDVMKIYLSESAILGAGGGILGLIMGYVIIFLMHASSLSLFSFPLSELSLFPSVSFIMGLMILSTGVGFLSVLGLLLKVLRNPSIYLIRVQ